MKNLLFISELTLKRSFPSVSFFFSSAILFWTAVKFLGGEKKVIRKNISCHWQNKLIHFAKQHLENMLDKEVCPLEDKKAINAVMVKKDIKREKIFL